MLELLLLLLEELDGLLLEERLWLLELELGVLWLEWLELLLELELLLLDVRLLLLDDELLLRLELLELLFNGSSNPVFLWTCPPSASVTKPLVAVPNWCHSRLSTYSTRPKVAFGFSVPPEIIDDRKELESVVHARPILPNMF